MVSPVQGVLPLERHDPYNNRGLFADHYLRERLKDLDEWKQATGVAEAFEHIRTLYTQQKARLNDRTNEAQTERDFIQPILNFLWKEQQEGDCYQVQVSIPSVHGRPQPDYAFFRSAQERQEADQHKGSLDYWRNVPVLGDAKKWTASLDKERGSTENPSAQICNYLYLSGVRWGILTNGRIWRLYEREKSRAGGIYYEVNLESLIQSGDLESFKYFYLFFRREAFLPDRNGITFIEKVFQGSEEYATAVSDRLKESVYDALRHLMNGFFEYSANELDRHDPETLRLVHENALIVLYRLLFLLYAEDKGLMPLDTSVYYDHSLKRIHQEINCKLREGRQYYPEEHLYWQRLMELFRLIDEGLKDKGNIIIPAYNGGLFSPSKYPHIAHTPQPCIKRWEIGDHRLTEVIDLLAYERISGERVGSHDIDYATLSVQHLGSIYEGLLELKPRIAEEPLVEVKEKDKPVFKPLANSAPNKKSRRIRGQTSRMILKGEVYLVTDKGERKATGSYYTPQYIVDYIVENTLGPLVEAAAQQVANLRSAGKEGSDLLEPYLALKILDPAMGSGHFLVGAADFLSLAMANDPNLPDVPDGEDPQMYYKRLVVERCLYGVDLNPLAVELAKLSLWLHTVSKNKALSFLDHHLRCGNSLIGARLEEDLTREPPQFNERGKRVNAKSQQLMLGFTEALTAKHLQTFLDTFNKIVTTPTSDAETERMKDHWYREMDAVRDRFRQVANLWLAPYFGIPVAPEQYEQAVNALRGTNEEWEALIQQAWWQEAQAVAHKRRFFHWELEFPEVFFDAHGFKPKEERGFDAVIGNPPYVHVRTGQISEDEAQVLKLRWSLAKGQWDLFALMTECSFALLRKGGLWGFIIPRRALSNENFEPLRRLIIGTNRTTAILDAGRVFPEADVECAVLCAQKAPPDSEAELRIESLQRDIPILKGRVSICTIQRMPFLIIPVNHSPQAVQLAARVIELGEPFGEIADITRGIEAGVNDPTISRVPSDGAFPMVTGDDVCRYSVRHSGWYVVPNPDNPAKFKDSAVYAPPKLLIRFVAPGLIVGYDDVGYHNTNVLYNVHSKFNLHFLCALLNSQLLDWWFRLMFQGDEELFPHIQKSQLVQIPIRSIAFTTPNTERTQLVAEGKRLCLELVDTLIHSSNDRKLTE